jgi:hypothetical protein
MKIVLNGDFFKVSFEGLNLLYIAGVANSNYRQSGWLCTRWGEIAQSFNFKYLYKSHCKSYELLWVLYNMVLLKSPQDFAGFAVTLEKIFEF